MTQTPNDALRLVPVEPTEAMIDAYFETCRRHGFHAHINATAAWTAMLAAAPASPLPEGGGWQDISTAPKDGTWIIGFIHGPQPEVTPICWESGRDDFGKSGWCGAGSGYGGVLYEVHNVLDTQPTHWMPLPAAPTGDARNGKGEG